MLEFLEENLPYVLSVIATLLSSVSAFLVRRSNKNLECNIMKFRTPQYREKTSAEAQSFDPLVTQYRYNKATGELEELPDKLDIQKLIDSHVQSSLEAMFDKFMPSSDIPDEVLDLTDTRDNLDRLSDAIEFADSLKGDLGLDEFSSLKEVQKALNDRLEAQQLAVKTAEAEKVRKSQEEALYNHFKAFLASQGKGDPENA